VSQAVKYLKRQDAFSFPGGVPTSMVRSGQQWDFSNAWPPLQELLITGLERSGDPEAADLAFHLASKWLLNIHTSYQQSNFSIFEKYDVEQVQHTAKHRNSMETT
jgi:alpha,alpha-trehalase